MPCRIAGKRLSKPRGQGRRELLYGLRAFFSWDGRGRLGFARSSPRTKA
jgi:hypothetical protein